MPSPTPYPAVPRDCLYVTPDSRVVPAKIIRVPTRNVEMQDAEEKRKAHVEGRIDLVVFDDRYPGPYYQHGVEYGGTGEVMRAITWRWPDYVLENRTGPASSASTSTRMRTQTLAEVEGSRDYWQRRTEEVKDERERAEARIGRLVVRLRAAGIGEDEITELLKDEE